MGKNSQRKIIGTSARMTELLDLVDVVAPKDIRILIRGERGTGKELIAEALHSGSDRKDMPFIKVNCASLTSDLLISELFGHVKGAFTGATETRAGLIAAADRGTLFLDEIGNLSYSGQASLLRFLQEGEVRPVGSYHAVKTDVRVISATNKNLERAMEKGEFQEDLFDRLNAFPLLVPPLRERRVDIPLLVAHFVEKYNRKFGECVAGFTGDAMARFEAHPWGGNVRELENVVRRAVVLARGKRKLSLRDVPELASRSVTAPSFSNKRKAILQIIRGTGAVTVRDLLPKLDITERAIRKHLQAMADLGLIKTQGSRKTMRYTAV